MKALHFPSFRAAAEFFTNSVTSYDEACLIVRKRIAQKTLVIGKTKTDWESVKEFLFFTLSSWGIFVLFFAFCAAVQMQTACPLWILFSFMGALSLVWFCYCVYLAKILFTQSVRNI